MPTPTPDGKLSERVEVPEGSTVRYKFDGGELEIQGPGKAYSKGIDGFFTSNGYGRSIWEEPAKLVRVGGRLIERGPSYSPGATWFAGPDPAISRNEKYDELTIEMPPTLSGINTLRLEGEIIKYEPLADISIQNLQIVNGPRASKKKLSYPSTQRLSGDNENNDFNAYELDAMYVGGKFLWASSLGTV